VKPEDLIRLSWKLVGNKSFCGVSCLLKFLDGLTPKSFRIIPTEIALMSERTRRVWKR